MSKEYDLVIIGGGPGGYTAAIRASQIGMSVAIVEKDKLGGTCLHYGCIPSKSLLRSAEVYQQTKRSNDYGVALTGSIHLDFKKVQERKNKIIANLHAGVNALMKKGKVDIYYGTGRILGPSIFSPLPGTISIEYENGEENTMIVPKNILLATGSKPKTTFELPIDGNYILDSSHALELEQLPASIVIIGGGVIGMEWASMLADFGVSVTVVEYATQLLPHEDEEIAALLEKEMQKKGITFFKSARILGDTLRIDKEVQFDINITEEVQTIRAEKVLVAIGREPNHTNTGVDNTDIVMDDDGVILTNEYYQTKESHIYAIGDCIGGLQLAHVASHEGIIAVEHMAGYKYTPLQYDHVPRCVYTSPELASVGLTEEQAVSQGYDVKFGYSSFKNNGKALVYGEVEGIAKIIADKKTNDILGVHLIGPEATNMISEAGLAKILDASPWEIAQTVHPHPSLSEVIEEAARAVDGQQIHG